MLRKYNDKFAPYDLEKASDEFTDSVRADVFSRIGAENGAENNEADYGGRLRVYRGEKQSPLRTVIPIAAAAAAIAVAVPLGANFLGNRDVISGAGSSKAYVESADVSYVSSEDDNGASEGEIYEASGEETPDGSSVSHEEYEMIADGIFAAYDRSKYDNISAPKVYYADYPEISVDPLMKLFSRIPDYIEDEDVYTTETERGYIRSYQSFLAENPRDRYIMSYWTDTIIDNSFLENSSLLSDEEFDFMTRSEAREALENIVRDIIKTDMEFTVRSVNGVVNGAAGKFYVVSAWQTIDGIPIFSGVVGGKEGEGYMQGSIIEGIYTENGLEYAAVIMPYITTSEAPVTGEFITLSEAEKIVGERHEAGLLTFEEAVFTGAELVYVPVFSGGEMILTPAWEFSDEIGTLYRINAFTGEEIR